MKNGGTFAAIGAMALAVLCCAGLPLIIGAVAAVGAGALFGGLGAAVFVALIAVAVVLARYRLRRREGGWPDA